MVPPHALKLPDEPITEYGEYWCEVTVSATSSMRPCLGLFTGEVLEELFQFFRACRNSHLACCVMRHAAVGCSGILSQMKGCLFSSARLLPDYLHVLSKISACTSGQGCWLGLLSSLPPCALQVNGLDTVRVPMSVVKL